MLFFTAVSRYCSAFRGSAHFTTASRKDREILRQPQEHLQFDEKGFLIGLSKTSKRIVTVEHLLSKKILGASQDGNREFISLIACICVDDTFLPPVLIYKCENNELPDTWLEDYHRSTERA